jgi:hypothetical protein
MRGPLVRRQTSIRFCSLARALAPRFFRTQPRGWSSFLRFATLHLHRVGRGVSPPSCRTCSTPPGPRLLSALPRRGEGEESFKHLSTGVFGFKPHSGSCLSSAIMSAFNGSAIMSALWVSLAAGLYHSRFLSGSPIAWLRARQKPASGCAADRGDASAIYLHFGSCAVLAPPAACQDCFAWRAAGASTAHHLILG